MKEPSRQSQQPAGSGLLERLSRRGVLRVAASYAVIAWLLLQIGDVVLDPFEFGEAAMRVLLLVVALGFPVALVLAWFFELTPTGLELDRQGPEETRPAVHGIRRFADVIVIGILVLVVAFLLAERGGLIEEVPEQPVVAVLPFANMSPEAQDAYFGEGLADTLIHKLGQLNQLVVLASQSTFQFKGQDLDLRDVGGKLGATVILLGSVQRAGSALRINARMVEVDSGRQLWAGSYDRDLQDVFAIQDEIAQAATEALHLVLAPEAAARLATAPTSSLPAYDAYVLGISRLAMRTWDDRQAAIGYFRQAIETDPGYALAYTGLAEALYLQAHSGFRRESAESLQERADEAAGRALALDPGLGEAWLARALAWTIAWDFLKDVPISGDDILALYQKAVELSPNNAMAHKYYAQFYPNSLGFRNEKSLQLMAKAAQLDPRSGIITTNVGNGYQAAGDYAAAETWYRQALKTQEPYFRTGFMVLVQFHLQYTGRLDEAARWARAWRRLGPEDRLAPMFEQDTLLTLDALEQARAKQSELMRRSSSSGSGGSNALRWGALSQGVQTERRLGHFGRVAELAEEFSREFLEVQADWPVLQEIQWVHPTVAAWSLADIHAGRTTEALARLEAAYPGPLEKVDSQFWELLQPVVIQGALYKKTGDPERGVALLRDYLELIRDPDQSFHDVASHRAEFTILAMLGEKEAALDALEAAAEAGRLYQWWALQDGAFDPDYAAVIADPRFEALFARIESQVQAQREAFFARPDLPDGYLP